jgi:hypothetical protein
VQGAPVSASKRLGRIAVRFLTDVFVTPAVVATATKVGETIGDMLSKKLSPETPEPEVALEPPQPQPKKRRKQAK